MVIPSKKLARNLTAINQDVNPTSFYNKTKKMDEFIELVHEMRNAQKEYFKTRDKNVLLKSKELERKVDSFFSTASDKPTNNTILMNEVSMIINGVRYDAVEANEHEECITCDVGGYSAGFILDDNRGVKPIDITEEILLSSGFERKQDKGYASYEINPYDGHIIEVAFYDSGIDVFIRFICGGCHLRSIKYFHELQNIVRAITGKELTIKDNEQ